MALPTGMPIVAKRDAGGKFEIWIVVHGVLISSPSLLVTRRRPRKRSYHGLELL